MCRNKYLLLSILVCAFFIAKHPHATSESEEKWQVDEPIVTYWAGPGDTMPANDLTVSQLRAGGWNLGWTLNPNDLDLYHKYSIRVMLQIDIPDIKNPEEAEKLGALIDKVKNHPALYSYHLIDEPGSGTFPKLGELVAFIRERDPKHLAFINLLPTYASDGQLQVSDDVAEKAKVGIPADFAGLADDSNALRYREYLRQFVRTVKPDLISYDHYNWLKNSDGQQYFLNLALVRNAAQDAGIPFLNIFQTCDSPAEGWRQPNENEERWLTYTSIAYGAQGICHFRYDVGLWKDRNNPETPLPLYWTVANLNREFVSITSELQPLKSIGVYHCGELPAGGVPLPEKAAFKPESGKQNLLLGYFGKSSSKPTHAVVVNLDYKNPVSTTIIGNGKMEIYNAAYRKWENASKGTNIKIELNPGGGALIRKIKE